jgi:hypothetical protein
MVVMTAASEAAADEERYREAANDFVASGRLAAAALGAEATARGCDALPSFWTEKQDAAWGPIEEAFRRDWLQTMWHLGTEGCAELQSTVIDPGVSGSAAFDLHWKLARRAIRLGHGSASFWVNDNAWTADVEARARLEWCALSTGIAWEQALPLVRCGWDQGRSDLTTPEDHVCPTAA